MEDALIAFETAKLAKEKGFNLNIQIIYDSNYPAAKAELDRGTPYDRIIEAPTQSLLQKWLREVHNIHISVICSVLRDKYWNEIYGLNTTAMESVLEYNTYEEALENGLIEALKLIK